ncbi:MULTISPECIES: DNA alkylation repair protein [unclassified Nocardioides]|uniref:DNA alkylation repair protein n=1 Tax=unclassified Nocardioides TaxID=2615069 RepID=UPI00116CE5E5|nr:MULTISPECIES: DNA alkylation repair protein [unclassified Nocardioides]TQK72578.1 3-methyladenine DNA glycosylase AlkD [Nocardioides sp. SLBN-35]WGY03217.1 DNA alkylation repair protein [Nocardioides sp. QY071]
MSLPAAVRTSLRAAADASLAPGQQAYMKSAMPFLGVRVPDVRRLVRALVRELGVHDPLELTTAARELWDDATHREERYAAAALVGLRPLRGDLSLVPFHEHVARSGAWWDHVDEAAHRVAELHDAHPVETAQVVRRWSTDDGSFWVRRLAIISQLGRGDRVDLDLLVAVLEPNLADGEFFIRKAVGWSLREVAKVHPEWVRAYAAGHEMSPLSRREALKHL